MIRRSGRARSAAPALLVAAVVAVAATVASAAGARLHNGLYGTVKRGPLTPVCQVGQPCDGPAAQATLVFSRDGRTVGRARTDDDGGYRVRLPAGYYTVQTLERLGMSMRPVHVHVRHGHFDHLDFFIDTGIR